MRILIVTDSLGAPRKVKGEVIFYEETWVYKLTKLFMNHEHEVISMTLNGLDSKELLALVKEKLLLYNIELVIFQYGIVDCAPRVLSKNFILIFTFLKLSKYIQKIISKHHAFLTNIIKLEYVPIKEFDNNTIAIYKLFSDIKVKVINLPIAPACKAYIQKSPRISYNISLYNQILMRNTDLIFDDIYSNIDTEKIFLSDLHHLNSYGHDIVFNYLENNLKKLINK